MVIYPSDFGLETREELAAFIEERCYGTIGEFLERMASAIESETFNGNRPRAAAATLELLEGFNHDHAFTEREKTFKRRCLACADEGPEA